MLCVSYNGDGGLDGFLNRHGADPNGNRGSERVMSVGTDDEDSIPILQHGARQQQSSSSLVVGFVWHPLVFHRVKRVISHLEASLSLL